MLRFLERQRARLVRSTTIGFAAVLGLGGTVAAITSPNFTYTSTKTGYYSIHPLELAPTTHTPEYIINFDGLEDFNGSCYSTDLPLPQGSRITQVAVWYSSPPTSNPTVYLQRIALADGNDTALLTSAGISDDTNTRKLAVLPIVGGSSLVSNTGFAYGFVICPGASGVFRGARIAYTYTSAGD